MDSRFFCPDGKRHLFEGGQCRHCKSGQEDGRTPPEKSKMDTESHLDKIMSRSAPKPNEGIIEEIWKYSNKTFNWGELVTMKNKVGYLELEELFNQSKEENDWKMALRNKVSKADIWR